MASRQFRVQEGSLNKLCPRGFFAREADHRLGLIDAQHIVAGADQLRGPDAAAAAEVDHPSLMDTVASKDLNHTRRGAPREEIKTNVVDVGKVILVGA